MAHTVPESADYSSAGKRRNSAQLLENKANSHPITPRGDDTRSGTPRLVAAPTKAPRGLRRIPDERLRALAGDLGKLLDYGAGDAAEEHFLYYTRQFEAWVLAELDHRAQEAP